MMNTNTDGVSAMSTELGHAPRWYCLSADGMATLCADEEDAKEVAAESFVLYPQNAPYRAAQMVDSSAVATAVAAERERCIRIVETYQVPVGNSAAGEMAAEWTMQALREVRDEIGLPNVEGKRGA